MLIIGLWTAVLKPLVYIQAVAILFLEPEVTIFGGEGGVERTLSYQLTLASSVSKLHP